LALTITPAKAASAEPMTKVSEMMRLMHRRPSRPAICGLSAVARMARPSRVRLTSSINPAMVSAASSMMSDLQFVDLRAEHGVALPPAAAQAPAW
jgi:hypothetical protein